MSQAEQYQRQIIAGINDLPADKLAEVAEYVKALRKKNKLRSKRKIVKLCGLWKGAKISERDIKKAREETKRKLDSMQF
ncbi:MAG: hypothetical protein AAB209_07460 [Bacteroidota bacterium]